MIPRCGICKGFYPIRYLKRYIVWRLPIFTSPHSHFSVGSNEFTQIFKCTECQEKKDNNVFEYRTYFPKVEKLWH